MAKPPAKPRVILTPQTEVQYLKGCGPALGQRLKTLGIITLQDLLLHIPSRYEDRRHVTPIAELEAETESVVRARVVRAEVRFAHRRMLQVQVQDDSGTLLLRFFHFNEAQKSSFSEGRWIQCFGTGRYGARGWEMVHPEYRLVDLRDELVLEKSLTPVYPLTTGVTQPKLRALIGAALDQLATEGTLNAHLPHLPAPETMAALRLIHQPLNDEDAQRIAQGDHPAQQRLLSEELLAHQLCMRWLRRQVRHKPALPIPDIEKAENTLQLVLPFQFTAAQRRVLGEVAKDLAQPVPMLRLVQGDVGSGKTVVAAVAMLAAARAGLQSVLMAPTELLAEQHLQNFSRWFGALNIPVELLTGRQKKSEREAVMARIRSGETAIVIGTHALFQDEVRFHQLALVVVDEQHRFGVQQRLALRDKGVVGTTPHQLIMSATPIPRTLAQTLYADLDVSVIDELPPGRTPVVTAALSNERRDEVLRRIGEICAQGRQAYWVCTLVQESDQLEAQAAEETAARLRSELPHLRVGLVHGRLKADEKEKQMRAFKEGHTHLLVATTVIEVGVDVPNASIMIIENSERLGLSQLHQLRGRVGRGSRESQCVLMFQPPLSDNAKARLGVMRATNDGFVIAQKDLELRGPGEILGQRQTGLIGFKLADPVRDQPLIPRLQQLADEYLEHHPAPTSILIRRWVGDVEKYAQV